MKIFMSFWNVENLSASHLNRWFLLINVYAHTHTNKFILHHKNFLHIYVINMKIMILVWIFHSTLWNWYSGEKKYTFFSHHIHCAVTKSLSSYLQKCLWLWNFSLLIMSNFCEIKLNFFLTFSHCSVFL